MTSHRRWATGLRGLVGNLAGGLKATFLLPVREGQAHPTFSQLVALALLGIIWPVLVEIAQSGLAGRFYAGALPDALFDVPILIIACWALAWLARRPERTLLITVIALATDLWIGVIGWLLSWVAQLVPRSAPMRYVEMVLYYGPPVWLALATAVAGIRLLPIVSWRKVFALALGGLLIAVPVLAAWPDRQLWSKVEAETAAVDRRGYRLAGSEEVLYAQPRVLERSLAAIQPPPSSEPTLFFIGVAGYGEQDVFMHEVESVGKLFDERFGTHGHAILLINNRMRLFDAPIATTTSLKAAIARVGEVMHRDRDVLFLFLSSHGSHDHLLSLSMWPLDLRQLDAQTLRTMLDDAGIVNRVIVVSACYAGGFLDPLKDDHTLVITAAAADKNSFGCSNEADFTYFGKAYFDDALRRTSSFTEAFNIAQPEIAARERKDGYDPSEPQMSVGKDVTAILAPLEHRWAESPPAGAAPRAPSDPETAPRKDE